MKSKTNATKKRKSYTLKEKAEVIDYHLVNTEKSQSFLATKFSMPIGTINRIIQNKHIIKNQLNHDKKQNVNMKKLLATRTTEIFEDDLFNWFCVQRSTMKNISNDILSIAASNFAKQYDNHDFKCSYTWLKHFKRRYGIKTRIISGEEQLVDANALSEASPSFFKELEKFDPKDIFNADETALFYRCPPGKTLVLSTEKKASGKHYKERITLLLCASNNGEKLPPMVIGYSKKPRWIRNIGMIIDCVVYKSSKKAWMTRIIFEEWLSFLNQEFATQKRKICLTLRVTWLFYFGYFEYFKICNLLFSKFAICYFQNLHISYLQFCILLFSY